MALRLWLIIKKLLMQMDPEKMFDAIKDDMNGTVMPGWEPERMEK